MKHCLEVLKHGKHVAVAVPAVFGSLEDAGILFEAVKSSGLKYMMFETSMYRESLFAMHQIYKSGGFGELVYSEGEYYHYMEQPIDSYKGWRIGLPPQFYPTHSNAFHNCVTGGSFTEVSCMGMPSIIEHLKPENNIYKNPFGTEIALFRTSEGGTSRMAVSWDTPGDHGERGRVRGQKGSYYDKFEGLEVDFVRNKPSTASSRNATWWTRWFPRLSYQRICSLHSSGQKTTHRYCNVAEPYSFRYCGSPVGTEKWRTFENSTICFLKQNSLLKQNIGKNLCVPM
jgi:hypothetical protein